MPQVRPNWGSSVGTRTGPRFRRRRLVRTRRRIVRRFRRRAPRPQTLSSAIGYPRKQLVRLRYVDTFRNNAMTAGAMFSYFFRANGLFDPNQTGTGHQPYTYDTWATLYNHYKVLGSKFTASVSSATNSNLSAPVRVVAFTSDDSTTYTDYTSMQEAGRGMARTLTANIGSLAIVNAKYSCKKWFGPKASGDSVQASVGADPSDICSFSLNLQPVDQLTTVAGDTLTVNVQIDYVVLFYEPKDLSQS